MNLTITFGYKKREKIFDGLDIVLPDNKITVICGHNGAGKTTLLKTISGILPSPIANSQGWYVPAQGGLIQHFSLKEHLEIMSSKMKGASPVNDLLEQARKEFSVAEFENKKVSRLSTGQLMLASLIVAFASESSLLLLDEPFGCLDPTNAEKLVRLLKNFSAAGRTIVITSHDLYLTTEVADKIIFLKDGKVSWEKDELNIKPISVDELKKEYTDYA